MRNLIRLLWILIVCLRYRIWTLFFRKDVQSGKRLAAALEVLGPSFIKFGQMLSTRIDLIGEDVASSLRRLQDNLKPFHYKYVEEIFIQEFGHKPEFYFREFDKEAVAAASVAQVHMAYDYDGNKYAVKILRPKIEKTIKQDIKLFYFIAWCCEKLIPSSRRLKPKKVVETFADSMRIELDLKIEAASASELKENMAKDEGIRIPSVRWDITSDKVLTIEWVDGIPINDIEALRNRGCDLKQVASNLAIAFFNQAYRDGFFHADLHPGNLFVDDDDNIVMVDFGIMGRLDNNTKFYIAEILRGFLTRDYNLIAQIHFKAGYVPKTKSMEHFAQACRAIGEPIVGLPANKISVGKLLTRLFEMTKEFEMETQPQLLLLQKTTVILEGVGSTIYPEVNLWSLAEPWIESWMIKNMGIEARLKRGFLKFAKFMGDLPEILEKIRQDYEQDDNNN